MIPKDIIDLISNFKMWMEVGCGINKELYSFIQQALFYERHRLPRHIGYTTLSSLCGDDYYWISQILEIDETSWRKTCDYMLSEEGRDDLDHCSNEFSKLVFLRLSQVSLRNSRINEINYINSFIFRLNCRESRINSLRQFRNFLHNYIRWLFERISTPLLTK